MKNTLKRIMQSLLLLPVMALGLSLMAPVVTQGDVAYAQIGLKKGAQSAQGDDQQSCLFGTEEGCGGDGLFKTITNVLLFIIGAIAVIMLILGGIRYTISNGDQAAITSAKNTILYAIIGIVVAIIAYALVNFVISSFTGSGA